MNYRVSVHGNDQKSWNQNCGINMVCDDDDNPKHCNLNCHFLGIIWYTVMHQKPWNRNGHFFRYKYGTKALEPKVSPFGVNKVQKP